MPTYQKLLSYLRAKDPGRIVVKKNYFIIRYKQYHVTVFQDQWDEYQSVTNLPYYLFHISSDQPDNRCSIYFWADKQTLCIKKIPEKYFQYEQESFGFSSSTRKPCFCADLKFVLEDFGRKLKSYLSRYRAAR